MPALVKKRLSIFLVLGLWVSSAGLVGAEPAPATVDYARDIQPIFEAHCYSCHGEDRQRGGLRLDQMANALRGGDSGEPGIVPGDSQASFLFHSLTGADGAIDPMPLNRDPLSDAQIVLIRRWIDAGAEGVAGAEGGDDFLQTDHWSLKPVVDPEVPGVGSDAWCGNAVDAFVLDRLREAGLEPSPEAGRRRLIRRVFFTLHGLAPTAEQMRQYLDDERPDWYALMVDDLLASPRYGERWARHWLDIVRYADTNGFETNTPRPNAYHYRDYVIRAFNDDKPYDEFILDQLAGDTTGEDAATGFLVAGTKDIVGSPDPVLTAMQRSNELADMVNVTSTAFMGLTVACARCHNHKFDPILHADYYAMEALFAGVQHGEREQRRETDRLAEVRAQIAGIDAQIDAFEPLADTRPQPMKTRSAVDPARNIERFEPVRATAVRFVIEATNNGNNPCIDELEVYTAATQDVSPINVARDTRGARVTSSGTYVGNPIHQLPHLNDGRYGNSHSWIGDQPGRGWVQVTFDEPREIDRVVWGRDRSGGYADRLAVVYRVEAEVAPDDWRVIAGSGDRVGMDETPPPSPASAELERLVAQRAALQNTANTNAYAGTFMQPAPTHRLFRGDPMQPREIVEPGTITVLGSLGLGVDAPEQDRRVALARSLADPDNPLTARVMVNRIWQYHFGNGLVSTPSDFGVMGAQPTHPELLDYLASHFVESGWSIKQMHRLILNSNTFRQDSVPRTQAIRIDAGSTLLWRFPPRRQEAEVIRDSMLLATGVLDLKMFGPGFSPFVPNTNYVRVYLPKIDFGPEDWRRMIYAQHIRMERDPTFGAFDCPDAAQSTPDRPRSTTALQALNLFNSPFVLQQARLCAQRIIREAGDDPAAQVQRAYALLYTRDATPQELDDCVAFTREHGLEALCRVLFNTNEFLFVE